ncbi:MAG: class I SAM-dependent methyltransferase [Ilumatobacteraceae bacterium]
MSVANALRRIAAGDRSSAVAECAAVADSSPLARSLRDYLTQPIGGEVYVDPDSFERFISGGSNIALYDATIDALADVNEHRGPVSLLDIGCGDGRITAATVPDSCRELHLLEPSEAMLTTALERVAHARTVSVEAIPATLQHLLTTEPDRRWDAVQSTFALHNLSPQDRADALSALAGRTRSIAIVEFDVPRFADHSTEHADYAARTYTAGIAEYENDPSVITGFLMPVLVGQFAPDQPRHTHEQPIDAWADGLRQAGFHSVTTTPVAEFWWADAWLVQGAGSAATDAD